MGFPSVVQSNLSFPSVMVLDRRPCMGLIPGSLRPGGDCGAQSSVCGPPSDRVLAGVSVCVGWSREPPDWLLLRRGSGVLGVMVTV